MYSFRCSGLKVKVDPCVNLNCKFLFVCKIKIIINLHIVFVTKIFCPQIHLFHLLRAETYSTNDNKRHSFKALQGTKKNDNKNEIYVVEVCCALS